MRQTELHLTAEDRELIESYRAKGLRHAREVNRAHILSALDRGIPETHIMAVLGVGRSVVWRTRAAYLEGGAEYALRDVARPGKPRQYDTDVEAQISALACVWIGACRIEPRSLLRSMPGNSAAMQISEVSCGRSLGRMQMKKWRDIMLRN